MNLRHMLTNAFILLTLLVGSLCGLRLDRSAWVMDRSGTLVIAASWPISLHDLLPAEQRGGWLAPELIARGEAAWPGAALGALPGAKATVRAGVVRMLLSLAFRIDMAFGTRIGARFMGALVERGHALLLAPQIFSAGVAGGRADLLPGLFFAAYAPGASTLKVIPTRPAEELEKIIDRGGELPVAAGAGPWEFRSRFLDTGFYPALRAAAAGEEARGMADGTRIVLRYRVPGASAVAYCRRAGDGNECGNDLAGFSAGDRAVFSSWENSLPVPEAQHGGARALELLHECERGRLAPGGAQELSELVLRRRPFREGVGESTMPYLLRRCGLSLGDGKLAGVGGYWGRAQLVKNFQFTSGQTLLSGILGSRVSLGEEASPGDTPNWFSDYRRFFAPGFPSWVERAARNVPGLDARDAPTPRALRVLLALDSISATHNYDGLSQTLLDTALNGKLLTAGEAGWIRRNRVRP